MICLHLNLLLRPGGEFVALVWCHAPFAEPDEETFRIVALAPVEAGVHFEIVEDEE